MAMESFASENELEDGFSVDSGEADGFDEAAVRALHFF
jgi:hypothetical protein